MNTGGDQSASLEEALARTQADVDAAIRAASQSLGALKKLRAAVQVGNLRDRPNTMASAEQSVVTLRQQFANVAEGWTFDHESHMSTGAFTEELLQVAEREGLQIYEQDGRLYCYPALIQVVPGDPGLLIDKQRERRLRPSVLITHLRNVQQRPPRFKPDAFLESLFGAYSRIVAGQGQDLFGIGTAPRLLDLYELLTLLPGQSREYSKQEFARDIYLLDRSGVDTTRRGHQVSFPASTGTKASGSVIRVITEEGATKIYSAIAFRRGEENGRP